MKLKLTCKQASQIISQSLDGPLTWSDRLRLKFHLFICNACKRFNQQLKILSDAVRRTTQLAENDSSIKLSLEAKAKIVKVIDSNN